MAEIVIKLLDSKRVVPIGTNGFEIRVENYNGNMIIAGENNVSKITYRFSKEFIDNHTTLGALAPINTGDTVQITYVNANNEYLIKKYDVDLGDITENGTLDFVDTVSSAVTFSGYTKIYIQWIEDERVENGYIYNWDRFDLKVWSTDPNYVPGSATKYVPDTFVEANPTDAATKDLTKITIKKIVYNVVDSTRDIYEITAGTVLTTEVKAKILKAGRVINGTTIYYPEETDGGGGNGLDLFNDEIKYSWDLDSPFSTAERISLVAVKQTNEAKKIYGTDSNGNQVTIDYSSSQDTMTEGNVVVRSMFGTVNVQSPTGRYSAIPLVYAEETYFHKAGGTITGNVIVQGNLNVSGTTTTTETETLRVKDNLIVANDTGNTLVDLSGLAIKTNATDVYGIVYDIATDSVKLGLGKIVDNQFVFNEGEGNAVAIRSDSELLIDNHIIIWDATNHLFKDSGKTINDFASKNTKANSLNWTDENGNESNIPFMNKNIATSDDLNTFLTYGIYQNYGGAPINAPTIAGGRPAMLVVFSRKDTTDTNGQLTQLYIDTNKINIRFSRVSSGNRVWTNWMEIATSDTTAIKGSLNSSSNLNTLLTYGIYNLFYNQIPQNAPEGLNTNCILLTFYATNPDNYLQVIYTRTNQQYQRYTHNGGETWSAWTQIATTDYVDNAINNAVVSAINKAY